MLLQITCISFCCTSWSNENSIQRKKCSYILKEKSLGHETILKISIRDYFQWGLQHFAKSFNKYLPIIVFPENNKLSARKRRNAVATLLHLPPP